MAFNEVFMARVTVEDCIEKVENRFELIIAASQRAREISRPFIKKVREAVGIKTLIKPNK